MCKFFSAVSNGDGKLYYFDWAIRSKILSGELKIEADSHEAIVEYFKLKSDDDPDVFNRYEYNPLTKEFTIDAIKTTDDSKIVKEKLRKLGFKKIIPALVVKKIVHPFNDRKPRSVTKKDLKNIEAWKNVKASVYSSVWDSVWNSVRAYTAPFFSIDYDPKIKPGLDALNKLWDRGFVPSFDGKTWRLHSHKGIVYEEEK